MGELLANFLKGFVEKASKDWAEAFSSRFGEFLEKDSSWEAFTSWVSKFELPATVLTILTISGKWLLSDAVLEGIGNVAERIALRFVAEKMANDPRVQEATSKMSLSLVQTIRTEYEVTLAVFAICIIVLIVSVGFPLFWKTLWKRRLGVFVSFSHIREAIAAELEQCLGAEGVQVCRIPYREDATHQDIVIQATDGIKKCDGFVCLPGHSGSYVDHEVLAATAKEKPITFLISETDGRLPDTADKRYPVFRLESTAREDFKPLIMFLSYIGADLQSTWKLCRRAVSHPFLRLSVRAVFAFGGFSIAGLWFYCYQHTNSLGQTLINSAPEFSAVGTQVIWAHIFILGLLVLLVVVTLSYACVVVVNLFWQFLAQRRARLKTITAQFNRDDWIGVVPGLSPGGSIYECLFEAAPVAHHEHEAKEAPLRRQPQLND